MASPLLSVHHASAQLVAGAGASRIRVRTLDDVSLAVAPRELILLRGGRGSGVVTLTRMLGGRGSPAPELPRGTRVRRASIDDSAARAIIGAWQRPERDRDQGEPWHAPRTARTVYVLRVRAGGDSYARPDSVLAWRAWSEIVKREGSAVVLAEPPGIALTEGTGAASTSVREPGFETGRHSAGARVVTMHAGRIAECFALPQTLAEG